MTNKEIRERINHNNSKIETMINPGCFILNHEVNKLLAENEQLRTQCSHSFEDGYCIYCDTKEA